ncbi:MAG: hypothetical protein K0U98_07870 [Deltaproteobacteria bacterium]|nr:hypothetical protein [Deltaproteobacteria bacterium]
MEPENRGLTVEVGVVLVLRHRAVIVVMPVGHRLHQVHYLRLVLVAVGGVMIEGEV